MSRRIYKTIEEVLEPAHTALVVWDVQNRLVKGIYNSSQFLKNLEPMVEAARRKSVPVVYTRISPLPVERESPARLFITMQRFGVDDPVKIPPAFKPGTDEAEIPAAVAPRPGELILDKGFTSIFRGTPFEMIMRNMGIETLLFTGLNTNVGIDSSAREASTRGFFSIVVSDCCSTADEETHLASLKTMTRVCIVLPSQQIIKMWH